MGRKVKLELDKYAKQLEQKIKERTKELLLLQKINQALNSDTGFDEILQIIADGIKLTFGYDAIALLLLSDDRKYLILKYFSIDPKITRVIEKVTGLKAKGYKVPLFEGSLFKRVVEGKEGMIFTDSVLYWEQWTDQPHLKPLAKIVTKVTGSNYTRLHVPLLAKGTVVGTIVASSPRVLTDEDKKRLMAFGEQLGLAVQRAKLYDAWIKEGELKGYVEEARNIVKEKKAFY